MLKATLCREDNKWFAKYYDKQTEKTTSYLIYPMDKRYLESANLKDGSIINISFRKKYAKIHFYIEQPIEKILYSILNRHSQ